MVKFTVFDAPADIAALPGGRQATAADFGGGISSKLAVIGTALPKLGEKLDKKIEATSRAQADQAYMDGRALWIEKLQERKDAAPEGAAGFTQSFKEDYGAWVEAELDAEGLTPVAKAHLKKKLTALSGDFLRDSLNFESVSGAKMRRNVTERGLDADVNVAFQSLNMYLNALNTGLERIEDSGIKSATVRKAMATDFRNQIAHKALLGEVNRNPANALEMLEGDASAHWRGELTPDALSQLTAAAERKLAVQDAKALTAQHRADTAARAAVADVRRTYVDGYKPDAERMAEVTALVEASGDPQIMKDLSDLQAFSGTLNEMQDMKLGAMKKYVADLPKPGEEVTELMRMTVKAGHVLLGRKQAAVDTMTGDLTKQIGFVVTKQNKAPLSSIMQLEALARLATGGTAVAAQQMVEQAKILWGMQERLFTLEEITDHTAAITFRARQDGSISPMEQKQIDVATEFSETMIKILTDDGALSYYNGRSITVPAVKMSNRISQRTRFRLANDLQEKAGTPKYQFFLPHELSEVTTKLEKMDPADIIIYYRSLFLAGGPDAYKVFDEISKKGSPRIGYVAGMAVQSAELAEVATKIERGVRIIRDRGASKVLPPDRQMTVQINTLLGNALKWAPTGTREGMRASVEALYAFQGNKIEYAEKKEVEAIVLTVLNAEIETINGAKTIVPKTMKGKFDDMIEAMTIEDLRNAAKVEKLVDDQGQNVSVVNVAKFAQFYYAGPPNRYMLQHQTTGSWVVDKNGDRAVFNFESAIRKFNE